MYSSVASQSAMVIRPSLGLAWAASTLMTLSRSRSSPPLAAVSKSNWSASSSACSFDWAEANTVKMYSPFSQKINIGCSPVLALGLLFHARFSSSPEAFIYCHSS